MPKPKLIEVEPNCVLIKRCIYEYSAVVGYNIWCYICDVWQLLGLNWVSLSRLRWVFENKSPGMEIKLGD
jgi:hypothetical protein